MAELELQLDSNIRLFVVLPIVFITFYVWVMQHFVSILLQIDMKFISASVIKRMDFSRQNKGCSTLSNDRSWQANRSGERQCHHHVPMILIGSWIHTQRHTHLMTGKQLLLTAEHLTDVSMLFPLDILSCVKDTSVDRLL
uniref:Uncharacterized protein n=1 Tax=Anabas testudineus TaxID=64144 RepID=A0A7N6ACN3_ANATE